MASARAISSRLRPAIGRLLAGLALTMSRWQYSSISSATRWASRIVFTRQKAEAVTLSSTVMRARGFTTWKVRPMPAWQMLVGLQPLDASAR